MVLKDYYWKEGFMVEEGLGRPKTMGTDNIKDWIKLIYKDCIRATQDQEGRRSMTADLLIAEDM